MIMVRLYSSGDVSLSRRSASSLSDASIISRFISSSVMRLSEGSSNSGEFFPEWSSSSAPLRKAYAVRAFASSRMLNPPGNAVSIDSSGIGRVLIGFEFSTTLISRGSVTPVMPGRHRSLRLIHFTTKVKLLSTIAAIQKTGEQSDPLIVSAAFLEQLCPVDTRASVREVMMIPIDFGASEDPERFS